MKILILSLWLVFIAAATGVLSSSEDELDAQRSRYTQQYHDRIIRIWAQAPDESGLMITPPPEARMAQREVDRQLKVSWHGQGQVDVQLSAKISPQIEGVTVELASEQMTEVKAPKELQLTVALQDVAPAVDTIDIYVTGEVIHARH